MGRLFELAKDFVAASPEEIEVLLDRPITRQGWSQ